MMTTFIKERKIENETREVDVDDFTSFQAIIENNIMGTFVTSRNAIGSSNQLEVTVFGDYGTAKVCCEQPNEVTICIKSESNKDDGFQKVDVPSSYEINQLKDFIDFIQGKPTAYTPSFYDGFQNQKIIESIIESAKTGTTITIM
jgi:predicted dehydrogenase